MTVEAASQDTAARSAELARLIARHAGAYGVHSTAIAPLYFIRSDAPTEDLHLVHQPGLCIVAQGRKEVRLGEERYVYDPLNYLVVSVTLPVCGTVIEASPERPYLCLRLDIDPAEIARIIADLSLLWEPGEPARGLYLERIDEPLLDAVLRLVRLLDSPADIKALAPLALREIFYRLLRGEQGRRLYAIALSESQAHRIGRAIAWLNRHFAEPLRVEELARLANLGVSTLHHRFKAVTAMSPLQYQKQLRLQEARRLMLSEGLDAQAACYRTGYESPSQFSREYSRQFGNPPSRDISRLRGRA